MQGTPAAWWDIEISTEWCENLIADGSEPTPSSWLGIGDFLILKQ